MKELMVSWSERWNEAKALGLDVEPLTGKPTKSEIIERGTALALRIEETKKPKPPRRWPARTIQAVVALETVTNSYQAVARLEKSKLSLSDPLDVIVAWMEQYDESKAAGGTSDDAAAVANGWLKSQIEPEAE